MSKTNTAITNKKIIFTGPVGAGKTTAIQTMSDIPIVSTNEEASDMTKDRKPQTTVAMDYGRINIGSKEKIHLYGTPGQERFSFMWDILTKGALGLILLLDNSRDNPQQDLKFYLHSFSKFIQQGDLVIGITRMDEQKTPSIDDYRQWLSEFSVSAPVFTVDARERQDVSSLIQALLYSLDPGIAA
ncbi:ATP/GTP-binding protein [uncultured Cocleimonas sp.]|uniref:GTP-binding protein n=1 Tax=uncultured Cocleimonas sp. TaxID=1051587 RepID=UPI002624ED96|nr:ATP/GTP-binding protein [uncultured Cocleimonas sp.]